MKLRISSIELGATFGWDATCLGYIYCDSYSSIVESLDGTAVNCVVL